MSNSNRRVWDALCETDPAFTKQVSLGGRRFTSIDAMYQVLKITEICGPIGKGWGWSATHGTTEINEAHVLAWSDVTVWYCDAQNANPSKEFGPFRGSTWIVRAKANGSPMYDNEAWKKATTDALTKALSHIGTCADVFMGKFDDSKYVAEIKERMENRAKGSAAVLADQIINEINNAATTSELETVSENRRDQFMHLKAQHKVFARRVSKAKEARMDELKKGPKDDKETKE